MTGMQMLLKQIGLDPEKVIAAYNQMSTQLPLFLNALGQKVSDIERRMAQIERDQKQILNHFGINNEHDTAGNNSQSPARINGRDRGTD